MSALRTKLAGKYPSQSNDPHDLTVTVNWSGSAVVDELEKVESEIEAQSFAKFIAPHGDYNCDEGKYSIACLASHGSRIRPEFAMASPMSRDAAGGAGYSKTIAEVDASERGAMVFNGSYAINYTLRYELVNHLKKN